MYEYETAKLRGRIIEKFGSQGAFADMVKRTNAYVSLYLTGKSILDQKTIDEWSEALGISAQDIPAYFFVKKVHETE